jgi:hypothetical protein
MHILPAPDPLADASGLINTALATHKHVHLGAGVWNLRNGAVNLTSGSALVSYGATVVQHDSTKPVVSTLEPVLSGFKLAGLRLKRPVASTQAAGVELASVFVVRSSIDDMESSGSSNGFNLGTTDWSKITNCTADNNTNHGFHVERNAITWMAQWQFNTCLAQLNDGHGFSVQNVSGLGQMTLGEFKACATYANAKNGFAAIGLPNSPVNGVRISTGSFFGEDGLDGVHLNTYGGYHVLTGIFSELAGTSSCGINMARPATNYGCGIYIGLHNEDVSLSNILAHGNSYDGVLLAGARHALLAVTATNNGLAGIHGRQSGVYNYKGSCSVTGGLMSNLYGNTSQKYGLLASDGKLVSVTGTDMRGNAISPHQFGTNSSSAVFSGLQS